MVSAGYAIASLVELLALGESDRTDGYARLVIADSSGFPAWYMFNATSTATPDDERVLMPNDNPNSGRWIKANLIPLVDSGVNAGTYANANITVDSKGRIVAASNGSASGSGSSNPTIIRLKDSFQSITVGSDTDISFNREIINTLNGFDGTVFRAPSNGVYRVSTSLSFTSTLNSPTYLYVELKLKGNFRTYDTYTNSSIDLDSVAFPPSADGQTIMLNASSVIHAASQDDFRINAFVSAGSGTGNFFTQFGRLFIEKLPLEYTPQFPSGD